MREWIAAAQGTAVTLGGALSLGWVALSAARARVRKESAWPAAAAVGVPLFALLAMGIEKKGALTGISIALLAAALGLRKRVRWDEVRARRAWVDALALAALVAARIWLEPALFRAAFLTGGAKAVAVTQVGMTLLIALGVRALLARVHPSSVAWAGAAMAALIAGPLAPLIALGAGLVVGRHRGFVWLLVAFAGATAEWKPATSPSTAQLIEQRVPRNSVVYCDTAVPREWTTRRLVEDAELGKVLRRAFEKRADRVESSPGFRAARFELDVEEAAEVRFFLKGEEIQREASWRVLCAEAFDNSLVTACTGRVGVEFGRGVVADEVRVYGAEGAPTALPAGLRRAATGELKRRGITHVLAGPDGALADELSRNAEYWGVEEIAERDGTRIYRIR